jgi:arabinofuranan 3-O-arabinosyltransferase
VLTPLCVLSLLLAGLRAATGPANDLEILWAAAVRLTTGGPLYDPDLAFIYPPLGGWVLAPLGLVPFETAHLTMVVLSTVALVAAVVLALDLVGVPWWSPVTAGTLLVLALSRPVVGLLGQGNVDVPLVLAEVVVIRLLVARRDVAAGALLGLVCALKPTLAPAVLALVVLGRWRATAVTVGVGASLSVLGMALVRDGTVFVTDVLPLLQEGNRPELAGYNRSLHAAAQQLGVPTSVELLARAACVAVAVAVAWRRRHGPLAAAEVIPVLLLGGLLASAFSWANYSLYLLPLLVTVLVPGSLVRLWPAWVGVYLLWTTQPLPVLTLTPEAEAAVGLRPAWGWALLLLTCAVTAWRDPRPRPAAVGTADRDHGDGDVDLELDREADEAPASAVPARPGHVDAAAAA